jgi:putative spermidine/putrescine transport system substrate-binding protein
VKLAAAIGIGAAVAAVVAIAAFGLVATFRSLAPAHHHARAAPEPGVDLHTIDRNDFYRVVIPLAKREGSVDLYSFAPAFPPFWKNVLIPRFEAKYGIEVHFFNTQPDLADQQLIALHSLGRAPPADVYFAPGNHMRQYRRSALAAAYNLAAILPEASAYPPDLLERAARDGRFIPFHFNQTALAYDRARLAETSVPRDFDSLLRWAQAHPNQFALTAPRSGGSGQGLLLAVTYRFMSAQCRITFADSWKSDADATHWVETGGCMSRAWQYLRALAKVSVLTNGNADTQNLLANKAVTIGTVWEDGAYTFLRQKLLEPTVALTVPQPGMPGSADVLFVVAGTRHPAAALLLIDFALSRPIQQWKLDEMASRTGRVDINGSARYTGPAASFMVPRSSLNPQLIWPPAAMMMALDRGFDRHVMMQR